MSNRQPEAKAIAQAAKNYREQGYSVVVQPDARELPGSLGQYRPALIARRGAEQIAVEVTKRLDLTRSTNLWKSAKAFRDAGWRLDLIVVGEPTAISDEPGLLAPAKVRQRISAAESAARAGDRPAAILLLWTVIESLLRQRINDPDKESRPLFSPAQLLKEALARGMVNEREWQQLVRLLDLRNRVVHGGDPKGVDARGLSQARKFVSHLLRTAPVGQSLRTRDVKTKKTA